MAENVNDLKQKLGEEKTSEKKEAKAAPDKENKGNGLGAKAVNIGKGAASKAGGAAQSAISEGVNQADDEAGETAGQMSQDLQGIKDMKNTLSQLNDRRKEFGAAKANNQAAEYMKGLEGNASKAAAEGAKKTAGAAKKKATGEGLKAAFKGVGRAILTGIKFLFSNPIGWAILGFILILFFILLIVFASAGLDQEHKREGDYVNNPIEAKEIEPIEQTVYGLYYQKYADMSIYAGVDMSLVKEASEELQEACGAATSYMDPCSERNFKSLTGVDPEEIDEEKLYQEGTHEWIDLKVEDVNNNEKYIGLSAGALSQLDQKLHIEFSYPEQFIRPVAANCTLNMANFIADKENNDIDEDGKVTIKDCRLRKYDDEGNPEEITEDGEGNPVDDRFENRYWMDKTLYLSVAYSKKFQDEEGKSGKNLESYKPVEKTEVNTDTPGEDLWDYGLGTLAHYVAYFQPSRVAGYGIETIDVVCTADGVAAKDTPFDLCAGKKFGEVVTLNRYQAIEYRSELERIYSGEHCNEGPNAENPEGCGGQLYIPNKEIYFKDWVDGYEQYAENQDSLSEGEEGYIYTDGLNDGEYPTVGLDGKGDTIEKILNEPAVSTGVPNTEVKYAIDHAVTFAGTIKFNVKQQWVTQSLAEHTQLLRYTISKNLDVPVDSTIANSDTTEHDERGETADYDYDVCYYYDNEMGVCGFSEDDHMIWVPAKETVERDGSETKERCSTINVPAPTPNDPSAVTPVRDCKDVDVPYYKHTYTPGHYELNGRIFYKGKEVQLSDIQESYRDDDSSESYSGNRPSDDNKEKYSWGEIQYVTVASHKEGYLQTYAVYNANTVPDTDEIVGLNYLEDYIKNYQTIVPDYSYDGWACYAPDKTPNDKEWITESGRIYDYEYAANFSQGDSETGTMDPSTGITSADVDDNAFCYAKADYNPVGAAPSLFFSTRPLLQIASFAGKLKFEATDDGELLSDVYFSPNKIVESVGTSSDTRYRTLGIKYPEEFFNFAGMYGVDPVLAALIAAENGETTGNLMGVTDGTYTAYNLGTRSPATEHYGASHDSETTNYWAQLVKNFFSKIPFFKGRIKTHERDSVTENSKENITVTVNDGVITAIDNDDNEEIEGLTQEELSIKIASMKLQYLQEVYQFNMPMVLTAYKYGRDYVEAVLDVYEKTTGVSRAAAVASTLDTAWADFRGAFYPGEDATQEEIDTAARLISHYQGEPYNYLIDEDIVAGASDYIERVLSRLQSSGVYYQKVDREYLELTEKDVEQLNEISEVDTNTAQHSVGVWLYGNLRDTIKENDMTHSGGNRGNLLRSWGILTKETGTIEETDWKEITGGQISYPETTWTAGTFGGDMETMFPAEKYFYYRPDVTEETRMLLINDLVSFGDDSYYGETDYRDVEYWKHHYSRMLGSSNKNWKSTMSAVDMFGERPDKEAYEGETIDRFMFTDVMPSTAIPFGYRNNSSGKREYSNRTVYEIQPNAEGVINNDVYAPFLGKVIEVGENLDGKYVVLSVDNYKGIETLLTFEMLESVSVSEGDTLKEELTIGNAGEDGLFSISMIYDGTLVDFDEVFYSFPVSYDDGSWIPAKEAGPGGWIGPGGGGGDFDPSVGGGEVPDSIEDLVNLLRGGPVKLTPSAGNPYPRPSGGGIWCTGLAWEVLTRLFPTGNFQFGGDGGNGHGWARSACAANRDLFECESNKIIPGAIISSESYYHSAGHVQVVVSSNPDGSFCTANGGIMMNGTTALGSTLYCYSSFADLKGRFPPEYTIATPR